MKTSPLLPSNRTFQVWEYQVSHGNLLVRSPQAPASVRGPAQLTNIDIHFREVSYFALPRQLNGVEITSATPGEIERLQNIIGKPVAHNKVFILLSAEKRFEVIAESVSITENQWDIFESPIQFRSHFRGAVPSHGT